MKNQIDLLLPSGDYNSNENVYKIQVCICFIFYAFFAQHLLDLSKIIKDDLLNDKIQIYNCNGNISDFKLRLVNSLNGIGYSTCCFIQPKILAVGGNEMICCMSICDWILLVYIASGDKFPPKANISNTLERTKFNLDFGNVDDSTFEVVNKGVNDATMFNVYNCKNYFPIKASYKYISELYATCLAAVHVNNTLSSVLIAEENDVLNVYTASVDGGIWQFEMSLKRSCDNRLDCKCTRICNLYKCMGSIEMLKFHNIHLKNMEYKLLVAVVDTDLLIYDIKLQLPHCIKCSNVPLTSFLIEPNLVGFSINSILL